MLAKINSISPSKNNIILPKISYYSVNRIVNLSSLVVTIKKNKILVSMANINGRFLVLKENKQKKLSYEEINNRT